MGDLHAVGQDGVGALAVSVDLPSRPGASLPGWPAAVNECVWYACSVELLMERAVGEGSSGGWGKLR